MKHFFKNKVPLSLLLLCFIQPLSAEQSLRNKIGEMLIIGFDESDFLKNTSIANNIEKHHIGGVILFSPRNIKSPTQLLTLTTSLQSHAKKHRLNQEGPLFIAIDQEGGFISRLSKEKGFLQENLSAKALGEINDLNKTYSYSKSLANYLKTLGINLNFAPVLDLAVDPNNFIYKRERCFSNDPILVYQQSHAFINGMHKHGVITALKHFPGHGSSTADTHMGIADVTNTWKNLELEPYTKFIHDGYHDMIMISHVINQKLDQDGSVMNKLGEYGPVPTTFSKIMVTDLLRNHLGFQGVIITDDMCMGAIADQYSFEDALKYSINAGVDMIILANHLCDQTAQAIEIIENLVNSDQISPQRIDDSYNRILSLKERTKSQNPNDFEICKKSLE